MYAWPDHHSPDRTNPAGRTVKGGRVITAGSAIMAAVTTEGNYGQERNDERGRSEYKRTVPDIVPSTAFLLSRLLALSAFLPSAFLRFLVRLHPVTGLRFPCAEVVSGLSVPTDGFRTSGDQAEAHPSGYSG